MTADPRYEIADPYLAFWFAVLREDAELIEGGQGKAVQQRVRGAGKRTWAGSSRRQPASMPSVSSGPASYRRT